MTLKVGGAPVELAPEDVVLTETPRAGWAVAAEGRETLALDLTITPELRRAGYVREAIRLVQEARKGAGLDVVDRIELWWSASDDQVAAALRESTPLLAAEVLSPTVTEGEPLADLAPHHDDALGLTFWLRQVGG